MYQASLNYFSDKFLDYAGLFPPAQLNMADAVAAFSSYESHEKSNLLARFVIPAMRLEELLPQLELQFSKSQKTAQNWWKFSGIVQAATDLPSFEANLTRDCNLIYNFQEKFKGKIEFDAFEIPLPSVLFSADGAIQINRILERIQTETTRIQKKSKVFLELDLKLDCSVFLSNLAAHNSNSNRPLYIKLRTGGITPAAIPSCETIARVMQQAAQTRIPLKATAGMHDPVRHFDEQLECKMHGFLNIFCATMFAHSKNLSVTEIIAILELDKTSDFQFLSHGLQVLSHCVSNAEIQKLRNQAVLSFGSCSFEEPVEYLSKMCQ